MVRKDIFKMRKIMLVIILGMFLIMLAGAKIPLGTKEKGECIQLQQTCDSCTYVNLSSVTYPNSTILYFDEVMTKNGVEYNYTFCSTSTLGDYFFSVKGDKDGSLATEEGSFEVTYTGDSLNTQKSILYVALLGILIFFFILIIYFAGKLPNSEVRNEEGQLIDINNLKYFGSVLLFIAWMILIAIFYITSNLAFAYLGEILFAKILFMIYRICFGLTLPLVFVWFIWIFVQILKDKKLKRMITKGIFPTGGNKW